MSHATLEYPLHLVVVNMKEAEEKMPLSPGALEQKIDDVGRDAREAHDRNHERFDELKARVDVLQATVEEHGKRILENDRRITDQGSRITQTDRRRSSDLQEHRDRKIEITQVRFTSQQLVIATGLCISVVTGPWLFNWGLRSDVQNILTVQTAQKEIVSRIQEQQTNDIKDLKADGKLHTIQIQNLREEIMNMKTKGAK